MATKSLFATKDNSSHQRYSNSDADHMGRGKGTRLLIGRLTNPGEQALRVRSFVFFNLAGWWNDVEYVESATIELTSAGGGDWFNGSSGRVDVVRLTKAFGEGTHTVFHKDDYEWPSIDWTLKVGTSVPGAAVDDSPVVLNMMQVLRRLAPKAVEFYPGGSTNHGMAKENFGFGLVGSPESESGRTVQVWSREATTSVYRPQLTIVYRPKNTAPVAGLIEPSGDVSANFSFSGTYTDVDSNDRMTKVQAQVRKASAADWSDLMVDAVRNDVTGGSWSFATFDRTKLRKSIAYLARARVWDVKSAVSDWSSPSNSFTIVATAPVVTADPIGMVTSMDGFSFTGGWTNDSLTSIVQVDIQLGPRGLGTILWTKSYAPTKAERDDTGVKVGYQGPSLKSGNYEWRVRVIDGLGGVSAWSNDDTLSLSAGIPDDEGLLELTTGYSPVVAAQRIVLRRLRAADRGPGAVVATIEDGSNIGCSWYASAPGEFYFTLPVTHPQVSVCEPMTTHYSFQQYRQGRWKELAAGLLRDFDANQDDVVFYGMDYLGLLSLTVEAAKQSAKDQQRLIPTKVTGTDGSKYHQKTIRAIIVNQLDRARWQDTESPVKFIERGRVDAFDTKVTIYASFAERLSFLRGLIDSHKGAQVNGEERRSRLRVRWNPAAGGGQGRYQFEALDAVGIDRPNIRLEYGGLIQGYQVIALDDFATKIYGIGKVPNHTLPNFETVNAPGISQPAWGSIGRTNFWNDLVDASDLQRRARNMGTRMSRIGKRVALGIRVAGIAPFDGYDLLDNFRIDIEDGVVSTSQYGSGWWTVWGMEYRVYPDEHDEITFVLRPRGDKAAIDIDLIPSRPIHYASDFVWGIGPP